MRFSIKYKIFFLVAFVLFSAIVSSSFLYYNNIRTLAKEYAFKDLSHDLDVLKIKIKNTENQVDNLTSLALNNQKIIDSLNLISSYQDKKNYDKDIFDAEKKKILNNIKNLLGKNNSWSMAFFDNKGEVVAFKRKKAKKIVFGYSSFKKGKLSLYNINDKYLKKFKPKKLDFSVLNKFDIFPRKNEFVFKKLSSVMFNGRLIGYIRTGFVISDLNYKDLSQILQNKSLIINKSLRVGNIENRFTYDELLDKKENSLLEYNNAFAVYKKLKNPNLSKGDILIVSFSSNEKLEKTLINTLKGVIYISLLIIIIVLVLIIIFSNYFINKPLNNLLEGIKALKNNNVKKIKINSSDEISIIAKEFNKISFALSESFKDIERSNLFLENILNTVHMSIFIKDVDGKYLKGNKNFIRDCGLKHESELLGKNAFDIWEESDAKFYKEKDQEVIKTLTPIYNFEQKQTRSGDQRILFASKMPLVDKEGKIIGVLGVYDDITTQKLQEEKLKEKEKYLMQQSKLAQMGEMISMIAHQWRQPLAAISSTTNSLLLKNMMGKYDNEFFTQRLQNISDYSQHLSATINDFRDFFKSHKEKREVRINTIVDDSLKITQTSMENKNISIVKQFDSEEKIVTFPNELRQVVLNLLKNAEDALIEKNIEIKEIYIKTYKEDDKNIIEISDNAGGIPENIAQKVFEPYFSTKQNKDGTGLGLYMSKTIVEDHCGGKLEFSNSETGAKFKVIL